ncbi:MAG: dihydrolipoyl dehydrogenase [Pseudomonadota bacterium]|nr:dihydrolipoyl dehydrogenase [Pseudomonadota bacterium]
MSKTLEVDVAIIGGGSAGMAAYRQVREHTDRVVVIEAGPWGTTCARVGCMPSKLLIAASHAAQAVATAGTFGVKSLPPQVDGAAVMARLHAERDRFVGAVLKDVESWPDKHRLQGRARFAGDHLLAIDDAAATDAPQKVRAARIVIATGSSPTLPKGWRTALGDRLVVNDDVFAWRTLPQSVAVAGAGPLGLELAQALHRLGVRVRLYDAENRIGLLTAPELQALTRSTFDAELSLALDAGELRVRRDGDTVRVATESDPQREARFDFLLAAVGRKPNVAGLALDQTSLPLDAHGVPVFDRHTMQIGSHPVFMAGDASAEHPVLHEAADDGLIAGRNAASFPVVRVQTRRTLMEVVFSDPQIAVVGQSHDVLCKSKTTFATGGVSFQDQGRARVMAIDRGALQVYAETGTGRVLGAEMIGPAAEHIAHLLAWSIARGDSVQQMLAFPYYHPTIEEGLRTALRDLRKALRMGPDPVPHSLDCGPGC